jgi:hypothetical protein
LLTIITTNAISKMLCINVGLWLSFIRIDIIPVLYSYLVSYRSYLWVINVYK